MQKYLFILLFLVFSCDEPVIQGCTSVTACNYNNYANKDDGTCFYSEENSDCFTFAVIGDYGVNRYEAIKVADLVKSWAPDFIITVGDNSYSGGVSGGGGENYEEIVSALFGSYVENHNFWPSLGNHDYNNHGSDASEYLEYFSYLPGEQRYYEKQIDSVHLFSLDSEIDSSFNNQKEWLEQALLTSDAPYKFVYFHHPPFTLGSHGAKSSMNWDFADFGAIAVIAGHDHNYQRFHINGIPYFVNGLGGVGIRTFNKTSASGHIPVVKYDSKHGAMRVIINSSSVNYEFINVDGEIIDNYKWKLD